MISPHFFIHCQPHKEQCYMLDTVIIRLIWSKYSRSSGKFCSLGTKGNVSTPRHGPVKTLGRLSILNNQRSCEQKIEISRHSNDIIGMQFKCALNWTAKGVVTCLLFLSFFLQHVDDSSQETASSQYLKWMTTIYHYFLNNTPTFQRRKTFLNY